MIFEGWRRKAVALMALLLIAGLSWATMDAGRTRWLVQILMAGFALRIVLAGRGWKDQRASGAGSRYDGGEQGDG